MFFFLTVNLKPFFNHFLEDKSRWDAIFDDEFDVFLPSTRQFHFLIYFFLGLDIVFRRVFRPLLIMLQHFQRHQIAAFCPKNLDLQ